LDYLHIDNQGNAWWAIEQKGWLGSRSVQRWAQIGWQHGNQINVGSWYGGGQVNAASLEETITNFWDTNYYLADKSESFQDTTIETVLHSRAVLPTGAIGLSDVGQYGFAAAGEGLAQGLNGLNNGIGGGIEDLRNAIRHPFITLDNLGYAVDQFRRDPAGTLANVRDSLVEAWNRDPSELMGRVAFEALFAALTLKVVPTAALKLPVPGGPPLALMASTADASSPSTEEAV
jgi:hypothetical protein